MDKNAQKNRSLTYFVKQVVTLKLKLFDAPAFSNLGFSIVSSENYRLLLDFVRFLRQEMGATVTRLPPKKVTQKSYERSEHESAVSCFTQ